MDSFVAAPVQSAFASSVFGRPDPNLYAMVQPPPAWVMSQYTALLTAP